MDISDKKLVENSLAGDNEAYAELLNRYLKPVYNFLQTFIRDPEVLDDLTQITFIKAWKNLKRFDPEKNFKTWIFVIAKNTAYDFFRKKKTLPFSAFANEEGNNYLENVATDEILPQEILEKVEQEKNFDEKINELSDHYRNVLLLHYKENISFKEISQILDIPYSTIKSRHQRALAKLKSILTQ